MSNAITAPPNTYDFGYEFNYSLWTEGTVITMVNVPWNNDYRDIVKFADRPALNAYIDSIQGSGVVVNNVSYVKPNLPIRLEIPFNAAYKYNYLRAQNPLQPISGDVTKDYYYFITDVRYIAPSTTEVVLQLDVWQTFGFDATFGQCYIDRGHIGIANTKAFNNYGRDYLTIPEGLDVGSEYQIVKKKNTAIMGFSSPPANSQTAPPVNVLVVSTVDLQAAPGTIDAPNLNSATGGQFFLLPSGAIYYLWSSAQSFEAWLTTMTQYPWITQGIVSITLVPDIHKYFPIFAFNPNNAPTRAPLGSISDIVHTTLVAWRGDSAFTSYLGRYRNLKKFFTYPYMSIEVTTFGGSPLIIKPESWQDADAKVIERANFLPPNQRIVFSPYKYNAIAGSPQDSYIPETGGSLSDAHIGDDYGEHLDFSTAIADFPTLAIVNNMAINYLAANARGIAFQFRSADWSQQRALASNQVTYDQSSSAMNLAQQLTGISNAAMNAQNTIQNNKMAGNALVNSGEGIIGGGAGALQGSPGSVIGGLTGAIGGNLNAMLGIAANNDSTAVAMGAARRATNAQVGQSAFVRDTNKGFADWAAKGDYQNAIAGINSRVQDAALNQPSVSGQVGGDTFNLVTNNSLLSVRWKMIDQASMRAVGEYWLRYGYAVRNFVVPPTSLQVMTKFTYWKMLETYIPNGLMPEGMKQIIRGIFEKGVTVWANPSYIGNTDLADNDPLPGVSLP